MMIKSMILTLFGAIALAVSLFAVPAAAQQQETIVVLTVSGPQTVQAGGASRPLCGGRGQPKCGNAPALFEQAALGTCPAGSFFDIGKWQCWSCPSGYTRGTWPVDSDRACQRVAQNTIAEKYSGANYRGPLCPPGSFHDPIRGGECYSCPSGYLRSAAHIDAPNACFVPGGEKFAKATRHKRTIWPHECARGTFHDAWDGGGCWSCPSDNPRRTGYHINDGRACVGNISEKHAKATLVKQAKCEPGEFHDMRIPGTQNAATGGGCYTCPPTYARSAFAVDTANACVVEVGLEFKRAEMKAALTCPAGQHFDFISLEQSDINTRPELKGRTNVKPVKSGTCWSCPPGYKRGLAPVKNADACFVQKMLWYSAPFREPGLFGLDGAADVLLEATRRRPEMVPEAIKAAAANVAKTNKAAPAELERQERAVLLSNPADSTAAKGIVFIRLLAAIAHPDQASAAEKRLVESFRRYVIARRTHVAQDALDHHKAWTEADEYDRSRESSAGAFNSLTNLARPRPEYGAEALLGTLLTSTASLAAGQFGPIGEIASAGIDLFGGGFDTFQSPVGAAVHIGKTAAQIAVGKALEQLAQALAKAAASKLAAKAVQAGALQGLNMAAGATTITAKGVLSAIANAGPQIIIGAALTYASVLVEHAIEVANEVPTLNARLATARSDPNLGRLAVTGEGMVELLTHWSFATAGESRPHDHWLAAFKGITSQVSSTTPTTTPPLITSSKHETAPWVKVADASRHLAIGANGGVWRIGTDAQPGGFGIYRLQGTSWTKMPGAAVQIAVDPQGNAWAINQSNAIFRFDGATSTWVQIPGAARAISIGANGSVWVIGTDARPGGFGIYRWSGQTWVNLQGGAVKIAVDPNGNPAVIDDKGNMYFHNGSQWMQMPGEIGRAVDIAIGAKNHLWVLSGSVRANGGYSVYRWTQSGWIPVEAAGNPIGSTGIAVSPDGRLWVVTSKQEAGFLAPVIAPPPLPPGVVSR